MRLSVSCRPTIGCFENNPTQQTRHCHTNFRWAIGTNKRRSVFTAMLEQLYSVVDAVDHLLSYAYPSVDVTPVLLISRPEERAKRMTELSGASVIVGHELLAASYSPES